MTRPAPLRAGRAFPFLVILGVLVAGLSMRSPIVAPTPVLRDIEHDLGIGSATAGLLTTAPVLMFAVLTPIAALVIRRAGAELALMISLSGVLVGTYVRALPGFGWMLAGMVVIGASITVGNVVIPVIIRRDVSPPRVGLVTASYVATLNAGSLVTSLFTAPIADAIGWQAALLVWSGITIAGIVLWGVHLRRERRAGVDSAERFSGEPLPAAASAIDATVVTGPMPVVLDRRRERSLFRRPAVWLLVFAFSMQATIYYALTTWLPTLSGDLLGLDSAGAGALASVYQGVAVVGAFVVPLLGRFTPHWFATGVICAMWLILTGGMLFVPDLMWLWLMFGAIAHAGGFVVIFTALVEISHDDAEAAGMSALVQGGGYAIAALGAPAIGAMHEATGGWELAIAVLLAMAVVYTVLLFAALGSARRR
jgi:MFS transporter, CP family, cyanate transporter